MASVRVSLVAMAWGSVGCSLLYDTGELRGQGGTGPEGGGGASQSTVAPATGAGGGGGGSCDCTPTAGMVWLLEAPGAPLATPAPACPDAATPLAEGGLSGSLLDESSQCGGVCTGPSRVKVAIDDTCGVGGEGVPDDMTCAAKNLVPDNPGDTSLAINLEPIPCMLASPALVDMATLTRVSVCPTTGDACAAPATARICVPPESGRCPNPCFPEPATVSTISDTRSCSGVLAACSPPVVGTLELHDDAACSGAPTGAWSLMNAAICPAAPSPPASPTTSYWKYTPTPQSCDAFGSPEGTLSLERTLLELCCAPPAG